MRRERTKGHFNIKGKQRGYLRKMRQKQRRDLQMDQYMKTLDYIANADERATELAIEALKAYIEKNGERLAAERSSIIRTPGENPAVWFNKEYRGCFKTL